MRKVLEVLRFLAYASIGFASASIVMVAFSTGSEKPPEWVGMIATLATDTPD